jgi:hypothetical protein
VSLFTVELRLRKPYRCSIFPLIVSQPPKAGAIDSNDKEFAIRLRHFNSLTRPTTPIARKPAICRLVTRQEHQTPEDILLASVWHGQNRSQTSSRLDDRLWGLITQLMYSRFVNSLGCRRRAFELQDQPECERALGRSPSRNVMRSAGSNRTGYFVMRATTRSAARASSPAGQGETGKS